jgi:hypothetical protein
MADNIHEDPEEDDSAPWYGMAETFSLTGVRGGRTITLTWSWSPVDGGTVSGDPEGVEIVYRLAAYWEGKLIGLTPAPKTTHNHLSSPYTACRLMRDCLDRHPYPTLTGRLPMLPDVPPGAVR